MSLGPDRSAVAIAGAPAEGAGSTSVPRVDCDVLEPVFECASIRLAAWNCRTREPEWSEERVHTFDGIAFPRDVPFAIWSQGRIAVADPGVVLLHSADVRYRTRHPFGGGDRGVVVIPRRRGRDAFSAWRTASGEGFRTVPRSSRAHLLQEVLVRRADVDDPDDVEGLSALLLEEVFRTIPGAPLSAPSLRNAVEAARVRLAQDLERKVALAQLAETSGYSPFHLARGFRQATGAAPRRYRIRARLFAALPRVLDRESDLMAIAVELGFSSHSHLTAAFRAEFGLSPSAARRLAQLPARAIASVLKRPVAVRS